jgi:CheY-like chemotaxis protein
MRFSQHRNRIKPAAGSALLKALLVVLFVALAVLVVLQFGFRQSKEVSAEEAAGEQANAPSEPPEKQWRSSRDSPFAEVGSVRKKEWVEVQVFGERHGEAVAIAVGLIAVIVGVRKFVPKVGETLNQRFNPWAAREAAAVAGSDGVVEQKRFSDFVAEFRIGPRSVRRQEKVTEARDSEKPEEQKKKQEEAQQQQDEEKREEEPFERIEALVARVARNLTLARRLLPEISSCAEAAKRQEHLAEFRGYVELVKESAKAPGLRPVWQLASCLEGLLKQMVDKSGHVTASTLRTVAGALDLLEMLAVPGMRPDLADNPPARFLCVDDDPISRRAVCMALQKAFEAPAVAQNGPEALQLALEHRYDVVFLDIEMPGMDGFEVCTRLHETELNRNTPVVFVTAHSDFQSRAKSLTVGARDLVGKPFISFEIAVKALTLLLRGRREAAMKGGNEVVIRSEDDRSSDIESPVASSGSLATSAAMKHRGAPVQDASHLHGLRTTVAELGQTQDVERRKDLLGDVYVMLHSISSEAEHGGPRVVHQLSTAMGKLVRKLLENPSLSTASVSQTIADALGLLEELSSTGVELDLSGAPVRVLVVDDDPTSRLALSNAIQLTFSKPETAGSGDTALALSETNSYDVIFLDVVMPGMDGFAACTGIRKTLHNRATPVVFVTSQISAAARKKAAVSGGTTFVGKPPMAAEIALIALTFTLRKRKDASSSRQTAQPPSPGQQTRPLPDVGADADVEVIVIPPN